ncbi:MAG: exopolysaccharide biosynthesis protein, partial [Balneolaceae bacterium]
MNQNSAVTIPDYRNPQNLTQLLDIIRETANKQGDQVTLHNILDVVGRKTFGPILLLAGLVTLTPIIGDIPGVPVIMGAIVFLISAQVLFRTEQFWLPHWLLNRSVRPDKLCRVLGWLQKPAQFIDRFIQPRFLLFTAGPAVQVIAAFCVLIATVMALMVMIPLRGYGAGAVFTTF